jgi:hypothetical protein
LDAYHGPVGGGRCGLYLYACTVRDEVRNLAGFHGCGLIDFVGQNFCPGGHVGNASVGASSLNLNLFNELYHGGLYAICRVGQVGAYGCGRCPRRDGQRAKRTKEKSEKGHTSKVRRSKLSELPLVLLEVV